MASSAISCHARSNSLPSTPHPLVHHIEDQLCRLRSSEAASTSSSSITHQLRELQDFHDCVDELLLLPLTAQAIANDSIDGLLDCSLRLLDVCSIVKDALLQTKESAQEIQSIMRRRCEAQAEIKKFMSARKIVKKTMLKALKNLKSMENKSYSEEEALSLLGEVQTHVALVLESLLSFINGKKTSSKSFVSKLMRPTRIACSEEEENEFAAVDASVQSFLGNKGSAENLHCQLQKMESCIEDLEDGVESLFRRLIKTRVALLNIINY